MKVVVYTVMFAMLLFSCNTSNKTTTQERVENRGADKENWWDNLPRVAWKNFEHLASSDEWFEVYRITPHIIAIYEPGQFEEVISYLIIGTQKALLWDTGTGIGDIKKVVTNLTDLEVIVLNSHTHYDHVGGNHQFSTVYNLETDFTKTNTKGKPHEVAKEFISGDWIWKPTPPSFHKERYESKPFTTTHWVQHEEQIDLGGVILTVLHTPGHTPDAICLLDKANRILFTGDTFYPAPLYAHFGESNVDTYLETANYLAALQDSVDHLIPSHNEPWLSSIYLGKMAEAFQEIKDGKKEYQETDGAKEYQFEGFSILVK